MGNIKIKSTAYPWYVVFVLLLAYTVSFIDRQILTLLVGPIKRDLGISDTQMSLLIGLSFALFYTVMGMPIGRIVDSHKRTRIITIGIVVWSLMTAGCGLARYYWQLFIMRIGVGVGEAALSPAAFSIIADYFPRSRLGLANSIYNSGAYVGGAIAMMVGGLAVSSLDGMGTIKLPVMGEIFSWQLVFLVVGLPGFLVALLVKTVKEPPRSGHLAEHANGIPLSQVLSHLAPHKSTLFFLCIGFALSALVGYSLTAWIPTFLIRIHQVPVADVGLYVGLILVLGGIGGVVLGGLLSDWMVARGRSDARMRTGLLAMSLALVPVISFPLVEDLTLCLVLMAMAITMLTFPMACGPAGLQEIFPNQLRGQITAFYMLVVNLIGMACGPTLVALLTDYLFRDEMALGKSLAVCGGAAVAIAWLMFVLGMKPYRASVEYFGKTVGLNASV
ncbi:MFS transporter [Halioxenophilus sp. WMMB6]|uniref:spinster family MFS transporter n=1 Tax=Halioxenophilus sp. WMMB6 TaxID=3073815 RepID=UPI00295EBA8D|nr:MFS transporter [Halioxenophilus sp. WMMB6]